MQPQLTATSAAYLTIAFEGVNERISHAKITSYFIAVKAIEAWFLADTQDMKKFLEIEDFETMCISQRILRSMLTLIYYTVY